MKIILEGGEATEYLHQFYMRRYPAKLIVKDSSLKKQSELVKEVEDIQSEVKRPQTVIKKTSNPFNRRVYHKWSKEDMSTLKYCADKKSPRSHRTLAYLVQKLPKNLSLSAIRNKLKASGYYIEGGLICQS